MSQRWRRSVGPSLGVIAALIVFALMRTDMFAGFEAKTVDARLRLRGSSEAAPEVVVVAVDPDSIDRLGQWPWPRTTIADLIRRLKQGGARVIALDMIFSEAARCGPGEDEALVAAVREAGNVVPGFYLRNSETLLDTPALLPNGVEQALLPPGGFPGLTRYNAIEINLPLLTEAAPYGGHFVALADKDGTIRHYPLILNYNDILVPALALRAVALYRGGLPIEVAPYQGVLPQITLGAYSIPASERGELWLNWRGPWRHGFSYLPAAEVLSGAIPDSAFRDKLVIVGFTETGLADSITTPFDNAIPGVEVHATAADNLLHKRFLRDGAIELSLSMLFTLVIGLLCAASAGLTSRPLRGAVGALALLGAYGAFSQLALTTLARHYHLFAPISAGVLGFAASAVWRNVFTEKRAKEIRRVFARYVSPSIVDVMLKNPDAVQLGGERRELTVMFADIRGFTSLSETMPPEQTVALLGEFLTPMTRVIQEHGGTLDKYMGDGIMAFFGAPVAFPDHAQRAARAALAMQHELAALNNLWRQRGLPALRIGIGLNSGLMAVGNMGSSMIFDYTVIGDHVNLGARLEGLTKLYGVDIIASEGTVASLGEPFAVRELDLVRVKGRKEPVRIFELKPASSPVDARFAAALALYRAGKRDEAAREFAAMVGAGPEDTPSRLYLERCRQAAAASWDGVHDLG